MSPILLLSCMFLLYWECYDTLITKCAALGQKSVS